MIWKKILVPLDGSRNSFRGLDKAISFAQAFHATITGVFVLPIYHTALDAEMKKIYEPVRGKHITANTSKPARIIARVVSKIIQKK